MWCHEEAPANLYKRSHRAVENAVEVGDGHPVVGNGNAALDGRFQAVEDLLPRDHTAAALDDHCVLADVGQLVEAGDEVEMQFLARILAYPAGQLAAPDVLARGEMGARLQHQDAVAVAQPA